VILNVFAVYDLEALGILSELAEVRLGPEDMKGKRLECAPNEEFALPILK
jgi:hypothetical protein